MVAMMVVIIARRTGKDVNSHTVLDGIITTIMATIQRINIIGSREGSRNRRSEERFSRNAETELVCRLLPEKKHSPARPRESVRGAARGPGATSPSRVPDLGPTSRLAFFCHVTAPAHVYTLSLHDALPICTGKDVNSHTVLDGIITTIMATIQRINIIGSREGSRNRRRLKANQTGKKFRVGIKSNISTNRNNLISGVDRCIHLNAMKKTTITSINRQTIKI